ncbi:MAG: hypothetical protein K0U98_03165 [Deltaproteobacteria bacterium]|nr:hypothetical protein [Deltaproteobacteria bacterium]
MSGLCCLIHLDGEVADQKLVRAMAEAASHRGPVTESSLDSGSATFALQGAAQHSFLAGKSQGTSSTDGAIHVVCDAILHNRQDLLACLEVDKSLRPERTWASAELDDAALILLAYLRWGAECADKLLGDFAFVIWDSEQARVLAARSSFGVKPLYYARLGQTLCLASEAQQLLRHPGVSLEIDEIALADYLVDDTRNERRTFFRSINRLPAAHSLVVNSERTHEERFWKLESVPDLVYRREEEYAEHLLEHLQVSINSRIEGNSEPVGVFMSGGLDSCTVASLCQQRFSESGTPQRLKAMSYGFPHLHHCSESFYISAMATELGIDSTYFDAETEWLLRRPEDHQPNLETPFQGWEGVDGQIFSSLEGQGASVALTGLGGDNLFQGSVRIFRSLLRRGRFGNALRGLKQHGGGLGLSLPRSVYRYVLGPALPSWLDQSFRSALGRAAKPKVPPWIEPEFARRTGLLERLHREPSQQFEDPAKQAQYEMIIGLESVGRACSWLERKAAPYGIETRHPFMDRRLAEFALSVPPEQHYAGLERKALLRRAMVGRLPESVRSRQGKTAFGDFFDLGLRDRERGRVEALIRDSRLADLRLVNVTRLKKAYEEYCQGGGSELRNLLWYFVTLELWLKRYTEGSSGDIRVRERPNWTLSQGN